MCQRHVSPSGPTVQTAWLHVSRSSEWCATYAHSRAIITFPSDRPRQLLLEHRYCRRCLNVEAHLLQAVSRRCLTMVGQVRSKTGLNRICGRQSGTRQVLHQKRQYHSATASRSYTTYASLYHKDKRAKPVNFQSNVVSEIWDSGLTNTVTFISFGKSMGKAVKCDIAVLPRLFQ